MKKILVGQLICPVCLPSEYVLHVHDEHELDGDIIAGSLVCNGCKTMFPIDDGIAYLDPGQSQGEAVNKYELTEVVSSYLWSHYADLLGDEFASDAYSKWATQVTPHSGLALDLGGAVGRFTFEMSNKCDFAIGIDNSVAFIRTARRLMAERQLSFRLKEEGFLGRDVTITLPDQWRSDNVEFIVADAQRLPFSAQTIGSITSLNLVDKVPQPLQHIEEMNRVATLKKAQFLLSDPFSWSSEASAQEEWLGGTENGAFAGKGLDNIHGLLENGAMQPRWQVDESDHVWWKIRTHSNHYELIKSCFIKASR